MAEGRTVQLKAGFIFPLFITAIAILVGRLYNIQVTNHSYFVELANRQTATTVKLPAIRGTIFDRNDEALAVSLNAPAIYADPGLVPVPAKIRAWLPETIGVSPADWKKFTTVTPEVMGDVSDPDIKRVRPVIEKLAEYLHVPAQPLMDKFDAAADANLRAASAKLAPLLEMSESEVYGQLHRDRRFVWLKRAATEECAKQVKALNIRGVCVTDEKRRLTVDDLRLGQWLGFVGNDGTGVDGLELEFDKVLRGAPGYTELNRDGHGRSIARSAEPEAPPKNGCNLYLTIDSRIQQIVNDEMDKLFEEHRPISASAIVMEPSTGKILAIDSVPGLKLADFSKYSTEELQRRLRNHPIQSVYEYGSMFKPLICAAALDLGLITPQTMFNCEHGVWTYMRRTLHDTHSYGMLSTTDVIAMSSNIGASKIGIMLGDQRMRQYLDWYQFGKKTGITLPGEEGGIVTPANKWSYYSTMSVSMGQEIAGTPLQIATAFCSLVNGGNLMQPYIVDGIEDPNTGSVTHRSPMLIRRMIRPETSATMRMIMTQVVEHGTATILNKSKYPIGGKTGTAQKRAPGGGYSHSAFIASFIGFSPVDNPQLLVLVMTDQPSGGTYYGGSVSAPVVGRIIDRSLSMMQSTLDQRNVPPVVVAQRPAQRNVQDTSEARD